MAKRASYKLGLLRGLLSGERAYAGPLYVHIDVTHRCNLRCLCCRWHSPLIESRRDTTICPDISADMFHNLCDDLSAMGTRLMFFVGTGEPLLHPRIFDLIESAKTRGFELVMYTNGIPLTESTINRLIDLRLDVIRVSLWASTEEGFAEQVGPDSSVHFGDVIDGMKRLSRLKKERGSQLPLLELCQSITHQNTDDLANVLSLAEATGCNRLCFSPLVDFGEDRLRRFLPSEQEGREISDVLRKMRSPLAALSITENIDTMLLHYRTGGQLWRYTPCYAAWFFSYFRTDGKVFLCQRNSQKTHAVGDLQEDTFFAIWNSDAYRKARRMAMNCGGPAASGEYFCHFCSHSMNLHKVHQRFRFIRPALRLLRGLPSLRKDTE